MSNILVLTGATGKKSGGVMTENIGKNLDRVRAMFPDGIRAVVRASSNTKELDRLIPGVKKYVGDLTDVELLKKAFQDADTAVHVAGIHWSRQIVEAAAYCHVRRLILVHTTGIYSKYKEAGEEYRQIDEFVYKTCRDNGIMLTVLRPTMIYGNILDNNIVTFIKMVDRFPLMPVVNGARYALQPVHYRDLGDAYFAVLMNEETTAGRDFILSGGEEILLRDMLTVIGEKLGKKVKFVNCPFAVAYSGAWAVYLLSLKNVKFDYREKVQRLCEPRVFGHEEAAEAFGFAPRTFREGVTDEIRQYKEKYGR